MGICLNGDTPDDAWVVGRPLTNATSTIHNLFFDDNAAYEAGKKTIETAGTTLNTIIRGIK